MYAYTTHIPPSFRPSKAVFTCCSMMYCSHASTSSPSTPKERGGALIQRRLRTTCLCDARTTNLLYLLCPLSPSFPQVQAGKYARREPTYSQPPFCIFIFLERGSTSRERGKEGSLPAKSGTALTWRSWDTGRRMMDEGSKTALRRGGKLVPGSKGRGHRTSCRLFQIPIACEALNLEALEMSCWMLSTGVHTTKHA